MNLADCQRKLLGLFRDTYQVSAVDDSYIHKVALSKCLGEGRRNILLWRIYVLERTCPLTVTLLRRRNLLEKTVNSFIARNNISPFRETQAPAFLEDLNAHRDSLIASVSQFELALMKVRQGDSRPYVVSWDVEPIGILNSLALDAPFDGKIPEGLFQILVSREVPGQFQIFSVST